jgi:hypothetical protein
MSEFGIEPFICNIGFGMDMNKYFRPPFFSRGFVNNWSLDLTILFILDDIH